MTPKDAYALLGLTGPVGGDALKAAFRSAAKSARPDHEGGDEERFRRVIEAYRVLQALDAARTALPSPGEAKTRPELRPAPEGVLEITPAEAVLGLARSIRVARGRSLGLRLPPGLRSGETVRLAGQGKDGSDLLLTVRIKADGPLRVIGDDLWLDWEVDASILTHGGRIRVTSPRGDHSVTAPPALPAPHRLRIKAQGLPARAGRPEGHLFLTLKPRAARQADPAGDRLSRFKRAWARG